MTEKTLEIEKQEPEIPSAIERTEPRRSFVPRVDIYEADDIVNVVVDMPGVDEASVDITLEKDVLTIRGAVEDTSPEEYELNYREYGVGDYERAFALSNDVNRDQIEASMNSGVLRLTLPKAEELKSRTIAVRSE